MSAKKQVEVEPEVRVPRKQKEKYTGIWAKTGEEISFNREWGKYRFTDDECEALLAGERVVLSVPISKNKARTIAGELSEQNYKGHDFVGFKQIELSKSKQLQPKQISNHYDFKNKNSYYEQSEQKDTDNTETEYTVDEETVEEQTDTKAGGSAQQRRYTQTGQKRVENKRVLKDKPVYVQEGSAEEANYLNQLKADIMQADISFMDYNKKASDIMSGDYSSQASYMNKMYYRMMLSQCIRPLSQGINPTSILQVVGMYAGMTLTNKEFKQSCNSLIQQSLYPVVEKLSPKFQQKMLDNHELPIGLDSAAMIHLSWTQQAYDKMREPGVDIDEILESYTQATGFLKERCARSGISESDLNQMIRTKVGQLAQKNPEIFTLFKETAYDNVSMDDFHEEVVKVKGEHGVEEHSYTVWSGEFIDVDGRFNKDKKGNSQPGSSYTGTFTPRPPSDVESMAASYCGFLSGMSNCNTAEELKDFFKDNDKYHDLYTTMMVSDGYHPEIVTQVLSKMCEVSLTDWCEAHPSEINNLKQWSEEYAMKKEEQWRARENAGVAGRKIPTKFEEILKDSGEYYNYTIDV